MTTCRRAATSKQRWRCNSRRRTAVAVVAVAVVVAAMVAVVAMVALSVGTRRLTSTSLFRYIHVLV